MKALVSTSLLILAGVTLTVPTARAAISYNSEDIVVAFSLQPIPNHTGNTYLVDLGNASAFKAGGAFATGNIVTVNSGTASALLTDLSAAGLASGSTRTWSLQGANSDILDTFVSKAETTPGTGSAPYSNGSAMVTLSNIDINTLVFSFGTAAAASTVPNSFTQNTSDSNSYGRYVFGSLSPTAAYETFGDIEGLLSSVLDLYQITDGSGNAIRLGAFRFNTGTGVIQFSSDISDFAVPEPSTALLSVIGIGLCAAQRRRRA